jgi:hypothetical protein
LAARYCAAPAAPSQVVSNESLVVALSASGAVVVVVALIASWTIALRYTVNKRIEAALARCQ